MAQMQSEKEHAEKQDIMGKAEERKEEEDAFVGHACHGPDRLATEPLARTELHARHAAPCRHGR
jgi:hypothetical protein